MNDEGSFRCSAVSFPRAGEAGPPPAAALRSSRSFFVQCASSGLANAMKLGVSQFQSPFSTFS